MLYQKTSITVFALSPHLLNKQGELLKTGIQSKKALYI